MNIIQDQNELLRMCIEIIDQADQNRLSDRRLWLLQKVEYIGRISWLDGYKGCYKVGPKSRQIVVTRVKD
jgi:hypothetical protein